MPPPPLQPYPYLDPLPVLQAAGLVLVLAGLLTNPTIRRRFGWLGSGQMADRIDMVSFALLVVGAFALFRGLGFRPY
jgi:hypothetical protein